MYHDILFSVYNKTSLVCFLSYEVRWRLFTCFPCEIFVHQFSITDKGYKTKASFSWHFSALKFDLFSLRKATDWIALKRHQKVENLVVQSRVKSHFIDRNKILFCWSLTFLLSFRITRWSILFDLWAQPLHSDFCDNSKIGLLSIYALKFYQPKHIK